MPNTSTQAKPDVLVIWPNRPYQMSLLEKNYTVHRLDLSPEPDKLIEEVGSRIAAVVTTGHKGLTKDVIQRLPNLKVVVSNGVGYDSIDVDACTKRNIKVTNTPGLTTDDVADIAIALLLSSLRKIVVGDKWVRSGSWSKIGAMSLTTSARDKNMGIVGMGHIGQAIAARALPMGLKISYFGPNKKQDLPYDYEPDLIKLATWADALVLSCPGGKATQNLVDADVLAALGEAGTLVNVARGSVVDESALLDALKEQRIAGVGLDVFANEPDDGTSFAEFDNVVLYPHLGSGTIEARDAMAQLLYNNLESFFTGKPLLTPVN